MNTSAPIDEQERQRLDALRELGVLDSPPDPWFDQLLQAAARRFDAPMALLSLVDRHRVWFKARVGVSLPEIPRQHTFCTWALHLGQTLVVPDAKEDPRFRDNPYVTGPPHVRAYVGVPLRTVSGHAVGTLCLLHHRPHTPGGQELRDIECMAELVGSELIVRQSVLATPRLPTRRLSPRPRPP